MVKETKRPKPSVINVSEELGFSQQRLPEIGPGSHKPKLGRGGVALRDESYYGLEIDVKQKKGMGVAAPTTKSPSKSTEKPRWSDVC